MARGCIKENLEMLIDLLVSLLPLHPSLPEGLHDVKWPPLVAFRRGLQCWVLAVLDSSPTVGPQIGVQGEEYLELSSDYLALNKGPAFSKEASALVTKSLVCEDCQPWGSLLYLCLIIH